MSSTGWSPDPRPVGPVTDVSLLALVDSASTARIATAVEAVAPDLVGEVERLAGAWPGLHITLFEFIHAPGHSAFPLARDWHERSGAKVVRSIARLGPMRFTATALRRSPEGVAMVLDPPSDRVRRALEICARVEPPDAYGRGRVDPLHVTLVRYPVGPADARAAPPEQPVQVELSSDRFALATALEIPYGKIHHLRTHRSRERCAPTPSVPSGVH